jgi:CheY-like chemotaxis protein
MAKILIIDDDVLNNQLYTNKLTSLGHQVVQVEDAEQAQGALSEKYDLILLDLMIPKGDGITLLQNIKVGVNSQTTILIHTNLMGEETKQKCLQLGAQEVLYKVDDTPQTFIEKISKYLVS